MLRLTEKLREHCRGSAITSASTESQPHLRDQSLVNAGQPVSDVSVRQQRRKLSQLKTSIEKALWFIDSFGLDLQSVTVKSSNEKPMEISFADSTSNSQDHLSESALQTLYLLERFRVSDEFYHELAVVNPSLPRSYRVKEARKSLTEPVDIIRLPQPYHGAYHRFEHCLAEAIAYEVIMYNRVLDF